MNIQAIIASILAAVTGFAGGVAPTSSLPNIPFISDWDDDWDDRWDDDDDDDWDDDDWDDDDWDDDDWDD
ncbi:hypothetical protein [Corynebacterium casei]|uniref:hypothetical protein n=1 Tax=Corynebacterium casei TaxID=160386 RepID=UPI003FD64A1C